tara:strand:+ start:7924 stop:8175 length:252 start_codon:yes stop_codon:yes gene_type:complete
MRWILVQDAMFKLVKKYADRPENEWASLFYRILNSSINDVYRRNKVRNRYRGWLSPRDADKSTTENPGSESAEKISKSVAAYP